MAGFQQAANTITGAPARFNVQKSIVEELQRDLAGEKAFNSAVGAVSRITKVQAEGRPAEDADLDSAMEAIEKVPDNRKKDLFDILSNVDLAQHATKMAADKYYRDRLVKLQKRLDEYEKRPNVPKAIAMTSSYDLQEKEELKSGTTQTSR